MRANQFQAKMISCRTLSDNIFISSPKKYPDSEIVDLDKLEKTLRNIIQKEKK